MKNEIFVANYKVKNAVKVIKFQLLLFNLKLILKLF